MIKLYKEYVEKKRLANLQTKLEIFKEVDQVHYLSKRFILEEALGIPKERIEYNNKLWLEEQPSITNENDELYAALDELKAEFDANCAAIDAEADAKKAKKGLRKVGITK